MIVLEYIKKIHSAQKALSKEVQYRKLVMFANNCRYKEARKQFSIVE